MSKHQSDERPRFANRPTLLALLIGALVLAGGIALIVVTTGGSGHSGGSQRAAADVASPSSTADSTSSSAPAATSSTSSAPSAASTPASTSARASTSPATSTARSSRAAPQVKLLTYTVKRGDNLTVIARWFHLRGYQPLYGWNKTLIGKNPNLIFAGQKITVSTRGMTTGH